MHHVEPRPQEARLLPLPLVFQQAASALRVPDSPSAAAAPVEPTAEPSPKKAGVRTLARGKIHLITTGGSARVRYNGRSVGTTPLSLELPAGLASFVLEPTSGGKALTVSARVEKNAVSVREVALKP
jgi:hypothetical protein